jgi:hypothetical protein
MTLGYFQVETQYNKGHLDQTHSSNMLSHATRNLTAVPCGFAEEVTVLDQFAQLTITRFHAVVGSFAVHVGSFDTSPNGATTSLPSSTSCKQFRHGSKANFADIFNGLQTVRRLLIGLPPYQEAE